ncbi:MAG: hypothetical protein NTX87_12180 [Planctomycetota bacterium]|nr:hypothetical protein [Planctomycetota bacterium]
MKPIAAMMIALTLVALAGCGSDSQPPASGERPRIALIYKATTNPFF